MISVVIPTYNEEKAIGQTIKDIKKALTKHKYEIIAVDDGSKDKTGKILDKCKGINVLHNPYNMGYSNSIKKGMKASKGDYIFIIDADGTYPINDMPKLIQHTKKYDMVVGARTKKSAKIPFLRKPAKKILNVLANFMSGHKIPDLNSGMRVFKKDVSMEFFHLYPDRFSFTTTITLAFLTSGYSVKYVPISYYKRAGKSTVNPIKDFVGFINLIIRIVTYFNPFKIFFSISLLFFVIASFVFLYSYFIARRIADISIIVLLVSSVQIFLFGLIADLIVKSRK